MASTVETVGLYLLSDPFKKNIGNKNTVSDQLHSTEFVKTRLDKLSTVAVEVASFMGNPVYIIHIFYTFLHI